MHQGSSFLGIHLQQAITIITIGTMNKVSELYFMNEDNKMFCKKKLIMSTYYYAHKNLPISMCYHKGLPISMCYQKDLRN